MPSQQPSLKFRHILAVSAGNGLDFYDFLTYSFFATQIGEALFPRGGNHQLLFSLATFGVGFFARPLGSVVIGRFADRRGRKPAMLLTFLLMGVAVIGLALIPGYAVIGMAAPALAVACRLLQGFALGGEVGPNTAYLLEAAPPHRRGLYVAFQYATQGFAILISGLVGLGLASLFHRQGLIDWGWRIAFLVGAGIIPFTLIVRRSLEETLGRPDPAPAAAPGRRHLLTVALGGGALFAAGTIVTYTLQYLNTFAQHVLGLPAQDAFGSTVMLGLSGILADFAAGWCADRYGRKAVLVPAFMLFVLCLVPAFALLLHHPSAATLLTMTALFSILSEFSILPALVLITELLPARIRAGGLGMIYAISISLFGGTTQFVEQVLIDTTGSPLAPAFYATGALLIGLAGAWLLHEQRAARTQPVAATGS